MILDYILLKKNTILCIFTVILVTKLKVFPFEFWYLILLLKIDQWLCSEWNAGRRVKIVHEDAKEGPPVMEFNLTRVCTAG